TARLSIQASPTATEQGGAQPITVTLTTSDGGSGTATLAPGITLTADVVDLLSGTAASGADYGAFGSQTVSFGPGSGNNARRTVTLTATNDTFVEGNETVNLRLQSLITTLDAQASLGNTLSLHDALPI